MAVGYPVNRSETDVGSSTSTYDEIDLVGLIVSMSRYWKLMIVVFLAVELLGVLVIFMRPHKYEFVTAIQLAGYMGNDGKMVRFLTPASANSLLENTLIDQAITQYAASHQMSDSGFGINVESSTGSDAIFLLGRGERRLRDTYYDIERLAVDLLVKNTSASFNAYRSNIQANLKRAELDLERLENPQGMAIEKIGLQQMLLASNSKLESLKQQRILLLEKQGNLKKSLRLYQSLAKKLGDYIEAARLQSLAAAHVDSSTQAMTAMLLGNQIQQNLGKLTNIEQKISVDLPQELSSIQVGLVENEQSQHVQEARIKKDNMVYENYSYSHELKIKLQQVIVDNLKNKLSNVQSTQIIGTPTASIMPVGLSRTRAILGLVVVGLFVALMSSAVAHFFYMVKSRVLVNKH